MSHRAGTDPDVHDEQLLDRVTSRLAGPPGDLDTSPPRRSSPGRRSLLRRDRWGERLADVAARTGVTPRAVLGVLLLGAVVAGVLVARLVVVQRHARPVPLRLAASSTAPTSVPGSSTPTPTPSGSGGATSGAPMVLVHVVGQVRHAGVVRLPAGARVQQALEAAGGAMASADLLRVNLARPVVDGEQIVVPKPGQPIDGAPAGSSGSAAPGGPGASSSSPVDLNTAGLEELDALPGVGPVLAQRILDWRAANGRFSSVDELGEVSGIGDKVLDRLRPLVRV
ncbi:MAG TPA: helix-hairpin-helix domain-containing protein [Actinomycetales bacterium]|nr:helix-hairpin-helix domain-containing protein [Actinomycetales bacterium]